MDPPLLLLYSINVCMEMEMEMEMEWNGMDDHLHPFVDKDEPITLLYLNSIQSNPIHSFFYL